QRGQGGGGEDGVGAVRVEAAQAFGQGVVEGAQVAASMEGAEKGHSVGSGGPHPGPAPLAEGAGPAGSCDARPGPSPRAGEEVDPAGSGGARPGPSPLAWERVESPANRASRAWTRCGSKRQAWMPWPSLRVASMPRQKR